MCVLTREELRARITGEQPLVEHLLDPETQLQPNGVDLTLDALWRLDGAATLGRERRELPARDPLEVDPDGWVHLAPGCYLARFREIVRLPPDLVALGRPRSTLGRAGVDLVLAVWDAGYVGRSEALLVVHNPHGFRVQRGARLAQLVFFRATGRTEGYAGAYQGENLGGTT